MDENYGGQRSIDELLWLRYHVENRRNHDGTCSECSACCDRVLLLTNTEKQIISRFLKKNPKILRRIKKMYVNQPHRMCPFVDYQKGNHKCMIYNVRPVNCSYYNCDQTKADFKACLEKYAKDAPAYTDMWHEFLEDPIDISNAWALIDMLDCHGIPKPIELLMEPEKLNQQIQII